MKGYEIGNYKKSLRKILTSELYLKSLVFGSTFNLSNKHKKKIIQYFVLPKIQGDITNIKTFSQVKTVANKYKINLSMIHGIATNMTTRSTLSKKIGCNNLEKNILNKLGPLYWYK
tara:strand:- start:116 stop:463 length:348 start_codon:yes stop_codon:yes gene_type:complete